MRASKWRLTSRPKLPIYIRRNGRKLQSRRDHREQISCPGQARRIRSNYSEVRESGFLLRIRAAWLQPYRQLPRGSKHSRTQIYNQPCLRSRQVRTDGGTIYSFDLAGGKGFRDYSQVSETDPENGRFFYCKIWGNKTKETVKQSETAQVNSSAVSRRRGLAAPISGKSEISENRIS